MSDFIVKISNPTPDVKSKVKGMGLVLDLDIDLVEIHTSGGKEKIVLESDCFSKKISKSVLGSKKKFKKAIEEVSCDA